MEIEPLEFNLTRSQVVDLLVDVNQLFIEKQDLFPDLPLVACTRLEHRRLATLQGKPPVMLQVMEEFRFSGDWYNLGGKEGVKTAFIIKVIDELGKCVVYALLIDERPAIRNRLDTFWQLLKVRKFDCDSQRANKVQPQHFSTTTVKQKQNGQVNKHGPLKCNQWLYVEYFEKERTNLHELVDEWLRIREEKDFRERPLNPIVSMRTSIIEERRRRNT